MKYNCIVMCGPQTREKIDCRDWAHAVLSTERTVTDPFSYHPGAQWNCCQTWTAPSDSLWQKTSHSGHILIIFEYWLHSGMAPRIDWFPMNTSLWLFAGHMARFFLQKWRMKAQRHCFPRSLPPGNGRTTWTRLALSRAHSSAKAQQYLNKPDIFFFLDQNPYTVPFRKEHLKKALSRNGKERDKKFLGPSLSPDQHQKLMGSILGQNPSLLLLINTTRCSILSFQRTFVGWIGTLAVIFNFGSSQDISHVASGHVAVEATTVILQVNAGRGEFEELDFFTLRTHSCDGGRILRKKKHKIKHSRSSNFETVSWAIKVSTTGVLDMCSSTGTKWNSIPQKKAKKHLPCRCWAFWRIQKSL